MVLPFWCRLTQVILKEAIKRVSVCHMTTIIANLNTSMIGINEVLQIWFCLIYILPHQLWADIHSPLQKLTAGVFHAVAEVFLTTHLFHSVSVQLQPQTATNHYTAITYCHYQHATLNNIQCPYCYGYSCTVDSVLEGPGSPKIRYLCHNLTQTPDVDVVSFFITPKLFSWSLMSLFSTNMAILL